MATTTQARWESAGDISAGQTVQLPYNGRLVIEVTAVEATTARRDGDGGEVAAVVLVGWTWDADLRDERQVRSLQRLDAPVYVLRG